ncbi:unnamed protein product [Caenorhabditis bovis]|uniref:PAN2-PAN3 deadenylation complex subunit PAN3 n=1 Tax=Caenorhabditis bovis TaxID=2654633 RepID=A0A8S1EK22_9PELO|nr:unnamed protein product [Caenorhabditis bovis]
MAANFWTSSHAEQWIFDKTEILRSRAEDLKIYTEDEYAKFNIFWANYITAVATEGAHTPANVGCRLRQQVIATAVMYFKRFYIKRSFKDMCPFLVASTALFLACKVEEHTTLSVSSFLKNTTIILNKRWGVQFDSSMSKNGVVYDAEFVLVEILDCCLIVYHPNRPLNVLLHDLNKAIQMKDFDQVEAQCHKVVNDTLRCDVGLQFAPHCIAIASLIVGTELMGRGDELQHWLVEINTDFDKVTDCVEQIYKMYKVWKSFDEKEVKQLCAKLPKINALPNMMYTVTTSCAEMQSSDGFAFDGGPTQPPPPQIPAGSRLNQYLGANRTQPSFTSNSVQLHINAPPFIPKQHQVQQQFSQLGISNAHPQFTTTPPPPFTTRAQQQNQSAFDMQNRFQQENRGGTMYFYPQVGDAVAPEDEPFEEPDIHDGNILVHNQGMYAYHSPMPLPHVGKFRPKGAVGNGQTQFINPDLKMELMNRQLAIDAKADPVAYPDIPHQVEHLTNLVPLENVAVHNLSQTTYKAASIRDGVTYCIRRIHGYRIQPGKQLQIVENWKKLVHGNIVQLKEIVPNCRAFGDTSLIFVYDYYPLAETLKARHFDSKTGTFLDSMTGFKLANPAAMGMNNTITEGTLWGYVIQISAALRAIHSSGLAARTIELNKILIFSNNKILLTCCGIQDVLNPDNHSIHQHQQDDLHAFGCVLVALATGKLQGSRRDLIMASLNQIAANYSADMKNLITYLLSTPSPNNRKSIHEIMPMIGARFYNFMENMQQRSDGLEAELCKEIENGRLFRLLCKMNTVLERAEHNGDENWAETGDRYMLKLFRDYVFHQVTDQGKPWLDMAHIVQCLNKLDAGTSEKIEMVSRDGSTQIIVDYSQLKRCLEKSFRELLITNVIAAPLRH